MSTNPEEDVRNKALAVIGRHALPPFVRGYAVRTDEYDGSPGVWITFKVTPIGDRSERGVLERGRELVELEDLLDSEFRHEIEGYLSFYRFSEVDEALPAA